EPRIEAAQKFRIETAWDVDVGNWSLLAGRGDAALRQRPLARTSRPGQQAQPTHRPPTDPGQRIELRDPGGPRRTGRCRRAWRGAPESGLEHRNGLLQAIWHLSTPQRRDDENAVTSGLPGDVRPDAEADQILSNKCSVVKAASGKKAKVDRRMKEFEPLMGEWHSEGEVPMEPPMKLSAETKIERLGKFILLSSVSEPAEMPDSISIIGGAPDGEPQPMHYFDSRGVKRLFMMALEGSTWKIW